ncbi:MAG: hypothetical protein IMY71_01415 [Bacteroidetes bacterium]|nr:hypothetical protein [Bacteroidota bacterium]
MKRFTISFLTLFLLCILQSGLLHAENPMKTYEGTWKFTAEQAPFGYQAGTMTFEIKEDTLTGYLNFADSDYIIEFQNIEINDGGITLEITVEYEQVPIRGSVKDNVFTGTATSPEGPIGFSATRVVKGKK